MKDFEYLLYGLLTHLPSLATALACMLIAITRWRRHPKISLLIVWSMALLLLQLLFFQVIYRFGLRWLSVYGPNISPDVYYTGTSVLYNVMTALALALLLIAIFSRSEPSRNTAFEVASR